MNPSLKNMDIKNFVRYLKGTAPQQRRIVENHKYANTDEVKTSLVYYMDARDRVAAYHYSKQSPQWLLEEATHLENLARYVPGMPKTRLENNARALREYHQHFAQKNFEVMKDIPVLKFQYEDVVITSHPSLHAQEKGKEKIIKIDFTVGKNDLSEEMIKILLSLMAEAAQQSYPTFDPKNILYLDVSKGKEFVGKKIGVALLKEVKATCENISAIWDAMSNTPSTLETPDESTS